MKEPIQAPSNDRKGPSRALTLGLFIDRLRRVLKSPWTIAFGATFGIYTLTGFLLLPFLTHRYVPSMASEQLKRPVTLGTVRFNPLLFTLEIEEFSLKEPSGEPLVTLGHLFADLELKSLAYWAPVFRELRFDKLFVRAVVEPDGRLNFAKLADAFPPSEAPEPPPEKEAKLPRLVIDHLVLTDGAVEFADQSRSAPASERIEPINLKLDAISTLPDKEASHHVTATFEDGAVLDWHGQMSLNPIASDGELRLEGFKLATPWRFLRDRIALDQPEGQVTLATKYRFRQTGDSPDLALSEMGATINGLKLVPSGEQEPILALEKVQLNHSSLELAGQSIKIPTFTIDKGKVRAAIDAQGALNWQQLLRSAPTQPATPPVPSQPQTAAPSRPWRIDVEALKLTDVALQLTDASRRIPVDLQAGAFGLDLQLGLEAGAAEPKLVISHLGSEVRNIAVRSLGGEEPMLAIETFRVADGAFDLSNRTVKLASVSIRKGAVRTEVDETGTVNWQKLAQTASSSTSKREPMQFKTPAPNRKRPPNPSPPQAPWRVGMDAVQIEQLGLQYVDASRHIPTQLDVGSFGLELRAAVVAGAGEPTVNIDGLQSEVKDIVLREREREKPLASLGSLHLRGGQIDLPKNAIKIQQLTLAGGDATIERDERGVIRLVEVFGPKDQGKIRQVVAEARVIAKTEGTPWRLAVEQTDLSGFRAAFADRSVAPTSKIALSQADFHLKHLSNDGKIPLAFDGKLHIAEGGDLSVQGTALPTGDRGEAQVRLARFDLTGLQPYLAQVGAMKLESGHLSTNVRLGFQQKGGKFSVTARGEVISDNLMLKEAKSGKRFASWDKLSVEGIDFGLSPDKLAIREIRAVKPGANIEIFEDRTTNIDAIFRPKKSSAPPKPAALAASVKRVPDKPFPFTVQRVKVDDAIVDFSDLSLVLPFKTRIQNFGGTISGISNAPSARTLLKLDGRVDEYGEANLAGTLDLMQHKAYSDVSLAFRNVEMSSLSPYSGTFAGRRIQSGKLNAELQYRIDNSRLNSHGEIELDQLALGAEVVSPKAKSLPLDLAVALLTDSEGKIRVSIPVEGNVDNPEFAYGTVIWNAIATLITKAVTTPFNVLVGAFSSGGEDIGEIFFIPGKNGLPPAEIEKLKKLASGLGKRPNVVLKVGGSFDPKVDAEALKSWDVRTAVTEKLGIRVSPGEDPGPLAFDSAKTQKALEDLVDERGAKGALTSALTAFRDKNGREPRRIGALSSWMDKASEDAPFYQLLFDHLVESAPLPPKALEALADRRGQAIVKELAIYKDVDRSRLHLEKGASASAKDGRVPSKLELAVGGH